MSILAKTWSILTHSRGAGVHSSKNLVYSILFAYSRSREHVCARSNVCMFMCLMYGGGTGSTVARHPGSRQQRLHTKCQSFSKHSMELAQSDAPIAP